MVQCENQSSSRTPVQTMLSGHNRTVRRCPNREAWPISRQGRTRVVSRGFEKAENRPRSCAASHPIMPRPARVPDRSQNAAQALTTMLMWMSIWCGTRAIWTGRHPNTATTMESWRSTSSRRHSRLSALRRRDLRRVCRRQDTVSRGFEEEPDCFMIDTYTVGQDCWTDGFVTIPTE